MALTLSGHRRFAPMFKIAPGDFLHFAVLQNALSGQLKLLKIAPGDFFIRRHPWRSPCRAIVASLLCSKSLLAIFYILLSCKMPCRTKVAALFTKQQDSRFAQL